MVMKMVRYHHLIEKLLNDVPNLTVIGIVRHPCGVINSWLQAPKEFRPEWDPLEEWRYAPKKNQGRVEEFNGFEKWKEVAQMFLQLELNQPERFRLVQFEELVRNPFWHVENLLHAVGLEMHEQVLNFIVSSQNVHHGDAYSVYKDPKVVDRWRKELPHQIMDEILRDTQQAGLERFLI
jgi:hypothetical protein